MIRSRSLPRALRLAATAALLAASAPLAAQGGAAAGDLPPAKQLIDRYAEAIGGREKVMSHTSMRSVADVEMPAVGLKGTMEMFAARPNRSFVSMNFPGVGASTTGFDGTVGWTVNPMQGPSLMEGAALDYMRETADFYETLSQIPDPARYTSIETVERTEMGGRPCWKVKLVSRSGRESFNCYDTETGLLVGMVRTQETAMGKMETTSVLSDYKEFGGIKVSTKSVTSMMGQQMIIATRTVELDTVQPSQLEPPAEIRTLVQAQAAPRN
ncbi:MAG TPA: hypothetical protein VGR37_05860 [Longimicrobiaceae bacterium]|nr:hypothetical protein [Longimicrobiaceae bacterium]